MASANEKAVSRHGQESRAAHAGDPALGVLDQAPIAEGSSGSQALANSLDLARHAEALGYGRFWVAEHHATPMLACASPEALIGPIATATTRLRVGSGGVMLPHYSPFKVAETFSMFAGLFPDRIDLALGRAFGTDGLTAMALMRDRRNRLPDDFVHQLAELTAYLDDDLPAGHPFAPLAKTLPGRPATPEVWLLGSSEQSALWAAEQGLPYAFADFINPNGARIAEIYRDGFRPSRHALEPRTLVAVWALCAPTDEEAQRLAASARMVFSLFARGQLIAVPPVDKALKFLAEDNFDAERVRPRRSIIGSPDTVKRGILEVAERYAAQEVLILTITFEHAARRRSYELIARAFGLAGELAEDPGAGRSGSTQATVSPNEASRTP